jgi:hypothetical protein
VDRAALGDLAPLEERQLGLLRSGRPVAGENIGRRGPVLGGTS